MIVCASPSYLERNGEPLSVEDLGRHQAIVYRRSGPVAPWLFPRDGAPPMEVTPRGRLRLDDLAAIADAAVAGMGLAWLPSWLVRQRVEAGALVPLLPDQPSFPYDVHALWLRTPLLSPKVRVAIDALAASLPKLMTPAGDGAE
jgi:DNA-binding transcriptional LysR family regulator